MRGGSIGLLKLKTGDFDVAFGDEQVHRFNGELGLAQNQGILCLQQRETLLLELLTEIEQITLGRLRQVREVAGQAKQSVEPQRRKKLVGEAENVPARSQQLQHVARRPLLLRLERSLGNAEAVIDRVNVQQRD